VTPPREPQPPPEAEPIDAFDGPTKVDRWILVFVREPTLWPVLIVVVGHALALLAPLYLSALRDGNALAAGALVALAAPCVWGVVWEIRDRGVGALTGLLLTTWVLSGVCAVAADHHGFL